MPNTRHVPSQADHPKPIKRTGNSDRVYQRLKEDVLLGRIESGDLLSEAEIAKRFGVSRTPVREALYRLACERVVVSLPQRGHLVRPISHTEALEAYRVRELLEVEAAGEAARRITDEEVAHLYSVLECDSSELVLAHYKIHSSIARISGNRLLADFIETTLVLMQRMIVNHPDHQLLREEALETERAVIQALEDRDPEAARSAMRRHTRTAKERQFEAGYARYAE